jgi:hypothetical protein
MRRVHTEEVTQPGGRSWDHFGTTRYALSRAIRTSPHPALDRGTLVEQPKRLPPCPLGVMGYELAGAISADHNEHRTRSV